jgi:hypothetical protein
MGPLLRRVCRFVIVVSKVEVQMSIMKSDTGIY